MGVPVVGMILVESSWVRQTGMSTLFERGPESKGPSGDVRIIFVTSYNISDSTFAEIVFYPKALEGHWVGWLFTFVGAAYNLYRLQKLKAEAMA